MLGPSAEITDCLDAWEQGDGEALERLIPLVYERLERLASRFLSKERPGHTLDTGALVHEVYFRLKGLRRMQWSDREHFFSQCARTMRRILVEHARQGRRAKRGSGRVALSLEEAPHASAPMRPELDELDRALHDLAALDGELARIVELRYFVGLSRDEIALVLGISSATVTRRWRMARSWLFQHLTAGGRP
ncbi:MAG: ECF-type sigma factor [Acidobacteriota bacterium]